MLEKILDTNYIIIEIVCLVYFGKYKNEIVQIMWFLLTPSKAECFMFSKSSNNDDSILKSQCPNQHYVRSVSF